MKKAKVVMDKYSGKPTNHGYVVFYTDDELQRAIDLLNNEKMKDKFIRLVSTSYRKNKVPEANLIVKNLDLSVDQKELSGLFSPHGNVISCKVETYKDG
jgi:RNA recognition motif-containing protein